MQPTRFAVLSGRLMPTLAGLLKKWDNTSAAQFVCGGHPYA
jgi:hypothetical protein